jgi:hypothetical protein
MHGAVTREDGSSGRYRIPISLMYPHENSNGFGFVDAVSNADFYYYTDETAPFGKRAVGYIGATVFGDFLWKEGFTYVSVQWSKMTTELLGEAYGSIENGTDGYEIIRDAARLLRHPTQMEDGPEPPEPVEWVLGYGNSNSAAALRGFVSVGANRDQDGSLVFDGFLLTGEEGLDCRILNNDDTPQDLPGRPPVALYMTQPLCPEPHPDNGKVILIRTQTEIDRADEPLPRHEFPNYRVYDVAGVAHIPPFMRNLKTIGAMRQNPVSWRPVAKAMLRHLVDWLATGKEPPLPAYIEVTPGPDGTPRPSTDADGNVLGGIRLPHMATLLPDGDQAGAPLGFYSGNDPSLDPALGYGYARLGGIFEPFPAEERAARYSSREVYVDLVRRAAEALLAQGYILEEDRDAYVRAAEHQPW